MNPPAPRSAWLSIGVTAVSLLVIIGSVVALVLLLSGSHKTDNDKLVDDRAAVTSIANTFVAGQWTFDPTMLQGTTMPAFRAKVEGVITPSFDVAFQTIAKQVESAVKAGGAKRTVQIWSTGVAAITADKATVLVVGAYTDWIPKKVGSTDFQKYGEVPFRDVVSLVKTDGKWLVDSQSPAEGLPPTAAPSATSAATPTASATASGGTQ